MKRVKTFEQWTTDVAGDYEVNYGDKPQLSEIVIDTIKFIEDNFNNIRPDILNGVKPDLITFLSDINPNNIQLRIEKNIPMLFFGYDDYSTSDHYHYSNDLTDDDYNYLKNYFFEIFKKIREKVHDGEKEAYSKGMKKIEDRIMKKDAKKYNI